MIDEFYKVLIKLATKLDQDPKTYTIKFQVLSTFLVILNNLDY